MTTIMCGGTPAPDDLDKILRMQAILALADPHERAYQLLAWEAEKGDPEVIAVLNAVNARRAAQQPTP